MCACLLYRGFWNLTQDGGFFQRRSKGPKAPRTGNSVLASWVAVASQCSAKRPRPSSNRGCGFPASGSPGCFTAGMDEGGSVMGLSNIPAPGRAGADRNSRLWEGGSAADPSSASAPAWPFGTASASERRHSPAVRATHPLLDTLINFPWGICSARPSSRDTGMERR